MSVMLSFPMIFILIIVYFSTLKSIILAAACVVVGNILYFGLATAKKRRWMDFEGQDLMTIEY